MRNPSAFFVTCCNLLLLYSASVTSDQCVKTAECQCVFENTDMGINLSGTTTTTTSNFSNLGYQVTFNPCTPVNLSKITSETYKNYEMPVVDRCNDSSLICVTMLVAERINVGSYDTLYFETDSNNRVSLKSYSSDDWSTTIVLVCNNSSLPDTLELLKFDKTSHPKIIELKLTSNSSCLVKMPKTSSGSSGWATFFKIIFVIAFLYFVGGILFKKIFLDAHGMEMLPNHLFWISVIESIGELVDYVSSGCRRSSAYNEI